MLSACVLLSQSLQIDINVALDSIGVGAHFVGAFDDGGDVARGETRNSDFQLHTQAKALASFANMDNSCNRIISPQWSRCRTSLRQSATSLLL